MVWRQREARARGSPTRASLPRVCICTPFTSERGGTIIARELAPPRPVIHERLPGRPRQGLAIGAVTDENLVRVDLGPVGDVAAVASAVDFHGSVP